MAPLGAFSQIPNPTNSGPAWSAGGAQYSSPYYVLVCFCFGEEEQSVHYFLCRKMNNKILVANASDSLKGLWRKNMLIGPKQTKPKKKT